MLGAHIPCHTRWLFGPDEVFFLLTEIFLMTKMFVLGWYYQSKPIQLTFDNHFCKWNYWTPSLAVRQLCCRMITYVQSSFTETVRVFSCPPCVDESAVSSETMPSRRVWDWCLLSAFFGTVGLKDSQTTKCPPKTTNLPKTIISQLVDMNSHESWETKGGPSPLSNATFCQEIAGLSKGLLTTIVPYYFGQDFEFSTNGTLVVWDSRDTPK